jgi:hypothetical protein
VAPCAPGLVGVGGCRTRGRKPLDGFRSQLRRGVLRLFGGSAFWSSPLALAGFFQQLDISHGSPRDECAPGAFFFGVFFFDGFYGDSTGVVVDQPSVEAAPSGEPHGYSLSRSTPYKYPANAPPLSAYILRASYPYLALSRPSWDLLAPVNRRESSAGRDSPGGPEIEPRRE